MAAAVGRSGGTVTLQQRRRNVWDHSSGLPQQQVTSCREPLMTRLLRWNRVNAPRVSVTRSPSSESWQPDSTDLWTSSPWRSTNLPACCSTEVRGTVQHPECCLINLDRSGDNRVFSLFRWSREGQRPAVPVLQQRGRDQLPADALGAVRSPKAHHGAASGRGQGRDGQPGPHRPGKNVPRGGGTGSRTGNATSSSSAVSDLPSGGFVLPLHAAGSLRRNHSHLHRPGQLPVSQ